MKKQIKIKDMEEKGSKIFTATGKYIGGSFYILMPSEMRLEPSNNIRDVRRYIWELPKDGESLILRELF